MLSETNKIELSLKYEKVKYDIQSTMDDISLMLSFIDEEMLTVKNTSFKDSDIDNEIESILSFLVHDIEYTRGEEELFDSLLELLQQLSELTLYSAACMKPLLTMSEKVSIIFERLISLSVELKDCCRQLSLDHEINSSDIHLDSYISNLSSQIATQILNLNSLGKRKLYEDKDVSSIKFKLIYTVPLLCIDDSLPLKFNDYLRSRDNYESIKSLEAITFESFMKYVRNDFLGYDEETGRCSTHTSEQFGVHIANYIFLFAIYNKPLTMKIAKFKNDKDYYSLILTMFMGAICLSVTQIQESSIKSILLNLLLDYPTFYGVGWQDALCSIIVISVPLRLSKMTQPDIMNRYNEKINEYLQYLIRSYPDIFIFQTANSESKDVLIPFDALNIWSLVYFYSINFNHELHESMRNSSLNYIHAINFASRDTLAILEQSTDEDITYHNVKILKESYFHYIKIGDVEIHKQYDELTQEIKTNFGVFIYLLGKRTVKH